MYSIKPVDRKAIIEAAETGHVVVAQDHNISGGLGSIVGTVMAEEGFGIKYKILGVPDRFVAMAHAPYLYDKFGINARGIAESVNSLY